MSVISYYNGPQLTGEAITASRFCGIDPTASPDEMTMLVSGTAEPIAFVSQVALSSGQALYGMQSSGNAIIKCVALYNPIAGATLTATAAGEAKAAVSGDHVYAVALEPASGAGGYVRAQLVSSPIVVA
tara:strand:+ start:296 stop:682 length:387 start_codon:yes stop_codon:yes gene_type:complete